MNNTIKRNIREDMISTGTSDKGNPRSLDKLWEECSILGYYIRSMLGLEFGSGPENNRILYIQDTGEKIKDRIYIDSNNGKLYRCIKTTSDKNNIQGFFEEFTINTRYKGEIVDRQSILFLKGNIEYLEVIPKKTKIEIKQLKEISGIIYLTVNGRKKGSSNPVVYKLYIEDKEEKSLKFAQPSLSKKIGESIFVEFADDIVRDTCSVEFYIYR